MTTRRKPTPGTVSHGTMRPEDLIPAFLSVAGSHRLSRANRAQVREIRARLDNNPKNLPCLNWALYTSLEEKAAFALVRESLDYFNTEDADQDTHALFDILDTLAPAGHYFGAHPGDGSDYGFWQNEEG